MGYLTAEERYALEAQPTLIDSDQALMFSMTLFTFFSTWFAAHYWFLCIAIPLVLTDNVSHLGHLTSMGALIGSFGLVVATIFHRRESIIPFLGLIASAALLGIYMAFILLF